MKKILTLVVLLVAGATAGLSADKQTKKDTIVLSSDNVLILNSAVDSSSTAPIILKSRELNEPSVFESFNNKSKKPIYLFLNTPGGDIQSGLELIEGLKGSERPIHTVTLFAASMGFQISQNLGDRYILNKGVLMSHRASGGIQGSFGGKKPSQMDSRYNMWLNRLQEMDQTTVERTKGKQTLESYQNAYADELWLSGSQAVEGGYADKVVTMKCDKSLTGTTSHSADFMGIHISYELDNCPINTAPMNVSAQLAVVRKDNMSGPITMNVDKFVSQNGGFGPSCLYTNLNSICAADPSLSLKSVESIVEQFKDTLVNKKDHVVRMTF